MSKYNIRSLEKIFEKNNLNIKCYKCDSSDVIEWLEENCGSSEYDKCSPNDVFLTWYKRDFTAYIKLDDVFDESKCRSFFNLVFSFFSMSGKTNEDIIKAYDYLTEIKGIIEEVNKTANRTKVWSERKGEVEND